jgi:hypothetical protein
MRPVRTGGIRPELAHSAKKTGFLVTESNKKELTRQQIREWDDAVQEYLDSVSKKVQ